MFAVNKYLYTYGFFLLHFLRLREGLRNICLVAIISAHNTYINSDVCHSVSLILLICTDQGINPSYTVNEKSPHQSRL